MIATINTIRTRDAGILGTDAADRGMPLAEFAVPKLRGATDGDANVFQDDCETSREPVPARGSPHPRLRGRSAARSIRVCDLFDRPLVLSFWFTGGADCLPTQDVVDRVAQRFRGRVNFLSIDVRDDRDEARRIVEERGWTIPVGYDADGAVSNLYRVGGCPTVAFAYPGGILSGREDRQRRALRGAADRRHRAAVRASRAAGRRSSGDRRRRRRRAPRGRRPRAGSPPS